MRQKSLLWPSPKLFAFFWLPCISLELHWVHLDSASERRKCSKREIISLLILLFSLSPPHPEDNKCHLKDVDDVKCHKKCWNTHHDVYAQAEPSLLSQTIQDHPMDVQVHCRNNPKRTAVGSTFTP